MREIKFRAWDIIDVKMINNDNINFYELSPTEKNEYFIFMEYTGLKDKNSKEIYEGDIVNEYFNGEYRNTSIVKHDTVNPSMVLERLKKDRGLEYDFVQCNLLELEVIGNIYENKELLDEIS